MFKKINQKLGIGYKSSKKPVDDSMCKMPSYGDGSGDHNASSSKTQPIIDDQRQKIGKTRVFHIEKVDEKQLGASVSDDSKEDGAYEEDFSPDNLPNDFLIGMMVSFILFLITKYWDLCLYHCVIFSYVCPSVCHFHILEN